MSSLAERKKTRLIKLIGIGDSGTGKTGSLAELANNMEEFGLERIIIQDWDDGVEVLENYVKPEAQHKVFVETFRDKLKPKTDGSAPVVVGSDAGNKTSLKMTMAWARGMQMMNNWKTKEYDLGKALDWGPETLFVCDTLTGMGDASMNFANAILEEDDWRGTGSAMGFQDKYTQMCQGLGCHFILFSHIRFMGGGGKISVIETADKGGQVSTKEVDSRVDGTAYPSALGKKLPPEIARHFNAQLECVLKGNKRKVLTQGSEKISLKIPVKMKDELAQETALVEVFRAMKGK